MNPFNRPDPNQLTRIVGQPYNLPVRQDILTVLPLDPGDRQEPANLMWYLSLLWRKKRLLAFTAAIGVALAMAFTSFQTPVYTAKTTLEIQALNENFLNLKEIDPTTSGTFTPESYLLTQVQLMQSETLIESAVNKMNLVERVKKPQKDGPIERFKRSIGMQAEAPKTAEQLVRRISQNLTPRLKGQTQIVEVILKAEDPVLAADVLNTLSNELIEQSQERRWQSTQKTGEWLGRHLKELKVKLEKSEAELQAYAGSTGLVITSDKDTVAEQRLRQVQDELMRAQAVRVEHQSKYELTKSKPVEQLHEVIDSEAVRDYKSKLTDLRRELAMLETTLTPEHYKVQRVKAQIAEFQTALERERGNILRRIANDYDVAVRREKLLQDAYASQSAVVASTASKAIHYNALKREVETSRQVYESMLQRVKGAGIAGAIRASNISVVDPAKPPNAPSEPNAVLATAFGLLAGLVSGIGLVVIRERTDRTIKSPGFSGRHLNLPELGAIPSAKFDWIKGADSTGTLRSLRTLRATRSGLNLLRRRRPDILELATLQRRNSLMAESYRATLASMLFMSGSGSESRVMLVSSPAPNEGKTTVISNLGIALAEIGRKVVVIDADMRSPRLHEIFQVRNEKGLADCLHELEEGETCQLKSLIVPTDVPNLSVLPSGRGGPRIPNLLYSALIPELLRRLRREFSVVLIDSPPLLPIPDARVLARHCDGVILVLRAGHSTQDAAVAAYQRLAEDGTTVFGTILTDWNPTEVTGYGYGQAYLAKDYRARDSA
jgi:capsular exopolysaccharide synthesis family protein